MKADLEAARTSAIKAFFELERLTTETLLRLPGWRMDHAPLHAVLQTDDVAKIREFESAVRQRTDALRNASIIN